MANSRASKHACVTLQRPPPEIRTLLRNSALFSSSVTRAPASAAVMAATKPAGPPPATMIVRVFTAAAYRGDARRSRRLSVHHALGGRQSVAGKNAVAVGFENLLQLPFMEYDHLIQAFSPNGTDQPFDEGILPR